VDGPKFGHAAGGYRCPSHYATRAEPRSARHRPALRSSSPPSESQPLMRRARAAVTQGTGSCARAIHAPPASYDVRPDAMCTRARPARRGTHVQGAGGRPAGRYVRVRVRVCMRCKPRTARAVCAVPMHATLLPEDATPAGPPLRAPTHHGGQPRAPSSSRLLTCAPAYGSMRVRALASASIVCVTP
jgi:hypothetical protein